ncbi:amidohydrolase family protein (plasmid) [Agrobacterium salinitolerans]|uniref:amidohydrolase family protein n=1 Tax=Agrobacterium salinitolerans TaxID=1183413 RepID=UPI001C2456C1|nr:amidohydrolase family protein [Agrobacterium salinitolerans]QXC52463.1 amidohydrolase family protein [Agrobacterium salinitolerans]
MPTELTDFIYSSPMCSTHEHTEYEHYYCASKPDVLTQLFDNYVVHDLRSAGAPEEKLGALIDPPSGDVGNRFQDIQPHWNNIQHSGYAEAVTLTAMQLFGIDELTPDSVATAQHCNPYPGKEGERLAILKDVAGLDHVQIDTNSRPLPLEMIGQDFFLYDLNMFDFAAGNPDFNQIESQLGEKIESLEALEAAIGTLFAISSNYAVAVKTQHAYARTLKWSPRSNEEAALALQNVRQARSGASDADRLCLGDWCLSRIAEQCAAHNLPWKIHTGYFAKNNFMPTDNLRAGNLDGLIRANPRTRFVLMHIAYPYSDEMIALAKHYANVSVDMCWAWSINPLHASDFLRRYMHAAPKNKLFIFGGDAHLPAASVGYSQQCRNWFRRTLQKEMSEGFLIEKQAIELARFFMVGNPYDYYDLTSKKGILREATTKTVEERGHGRAFGFPPKGIRDSGKA